MSDELAGHSTKLRVPRPAGMDPATKRLVLIAAGLGGTLLAVLGAWSTLGGHHASVPVIAAPDAPLRVKPDNPGGLKVGDDSILSGRLSDAGGDKLAPRPETPNPQGLTAPTAAPAEPPPPVSAPASAPAKAAAPAPAATPAPAAAPPAPAPHAEAKPAAPAPRQAATRGVQVQLAALSTRQEAEAQWRTLLRRDARLLAGHTPSFHEATANGRTWWRVRTGGFADDAQARAFCDKVRATGGACSVAKF
ncbi:MAG: SPOR domain-containing protein [Acetobacteraceae bacterium]|nr:SPOR domain-containing protein [Acetobacteraceae bacterium]